VGSVSTRTELKNNLRQLILLGDRGCIPWYWSKDGDVLQLVRWQASRKVIAAYHQGDDLKSHLRADCLYTGITNARWWVWENFTCTFITALEHCCSYKLYWCTGYISVTEGAVIILADYVSLQQLQLTSLGETPTVIKVKVFQSKYQYCITLKYVTHQIKTQIYKTHICKRDYSRCYYYSFYYLYILVSTIISITNIILWALLVHKFKYIKQLYSEIFL